MSRTYRIVVPLLGAWLLGWISLSWPAIQDDALIHLRYADNLWLHHFITYDGVHPNYGASSLLYVGILAALRNFSSSPNLARATSSVVHVLLFAGMATALGTLLPRSAKVARLAGLVLLTLMVTPSAVRWLDDGMETGLVVAMVSTLAGLIHGQGSGKKENYLPLLSLSFLAVLLRTELLLVCGCGFVILMASSLKHERVSTRLILAAGWRRPHLLVGAAAALLAIFATMHVLLPDTAVAKSHGISNWSHPVHDTAITLGGAYSFGIGMLVFWLLTLALIVLRAGRLRFSDAVANCFCPAVLTLSALRGQEIQGVRYFAWTFFFSIVWNVLELGRPVDESGQMTSFLSSKSHTPGAKALVRPSGFGAKAEALAYPDATAGQAQIALCLFLGLLVLDLPFESIAMHRVLSNRSATMRNFESEGLDVLKTRRGIASDIGYIGYFTQAEICDLAGLVNGRAAARMGSVERAHACLQTNPDFIFVNVSQLVPLTKMANLSAWNICGRYEFTNVSSVDTHYLLVKPEVTAEACLATARLPASIDSILAPASRRNF